MTRLDLNEEPGHLNFKSLYYRLFLITTSVTANAFLGLIFSIIISAMSLGSINVLVFPR